MKLPDFLAQPSPPVQFALKPFLPFGGVTLLYGKTRIGKSPLTWEMARCVAEGIPFLDVYPTSKGRVLYLDLDTAPGLVRERLARLVSAPENFHIEFPGIRNLLNPSTQDEFKRLRDQVQPIAVFINTLRKLYTGDEKDASLPSRIYAILQAIFTPAAILLVHHDKKSMGDPAHAGDPDEAFSGHMSWLNDCTVGLHLVRGGGSRPGLLKLFHSKSQVSEAEEPRTLQLCRDGTNIIDYRVQWASLVIKLFHDLPETMTKTERIRVISQQLKVSERSAWTYLSWLPDPLEETAATATTEPRDSLRIH